MPIQRTLSIIKPDAVSKNIIGRIVTRFEEEGLIIISAKMKILSIDEAKSFYIEHSKRPFFKDLVTFMTSGPVFIQVLEGENAISLNRKIMGSTNPKEATVGTIRADFADSIDENGIHGSDSTEAAIREISFFFKESEMYSH